MAPQKPGSKKNRGMWINVHIVGIEPICNKSCDVDNLATMQSIVDNPTIDQRIDQLTAEWISDIDNSNIPDSLRQVIETMAAQALSSNAKGKRLRARLALAAFQTGLTRQGGDDNPPIGNNRNSNVGFDPSSCEGTGMLDLACAIEIYQTSALIHDDLIDDSPMRRGRPSAHAALGQSLEDRTVGKELGLMLGNMLATASVGIAQNALRQHGMHHSRECLEMFLDMQRAVEIGQSLDIDAQTLDPGKPKAIEQAALSVYEWKTASYTTIAPIELGLAAAGMNAEKAHDTAYAIGLPLGIAFQLADDLIDVIADPRQTGKPQGGDIREGKRTVLLSDAISKAETPDGEALIAMYRAPARTNDDVALALRLFTRTGATAISVRRIRTQWEQARKAVTKFATDSSVCTDPLLEACRRLIPSFITQ